MNMFRERYQGLKSSWSQELRQTIEELDTFTRDPTTVMSLPRVFQAWGRRAA